MYVDRTYRDRFLGKGLISFRVVIKDTDLMIMVDEDSYTTELKRTAEVRTLFYRNELEEYIKKDPNFKTTLEPYVVRTDAPPIALEMVKAGNKCKVGPMAAVAGVIAERVGQDLQKLANEVIVENGGDLFISIKKTRLVGVFAGKSPLSNKLALKVDPEDTPVGICTSSGTVGPSLSFGQADAVIIFSSSTALADAAATAVGNRVKTKEDVKKAVELAKKIEGVSGVLIIKDDILAGWGNIEIVPMDKQ